MSEETEVFLRNGETWFVDAAALCTKYGGVYLPQTDDGDIYVAIPGKGEVPLAELVKDDGKPQIETGDNITTLKPAPRRT